jgi:endonuclease YncB( thermonuclease family)
MRESVVPSPSRRSVAFALAGAVLFALHPIPVAAAPPVPGPLTGQAIVIDGDTLEIAGTRVRLEGIDAPETAQTCGRRFIGWWACGEAATNALKKLVASRDVRCEARGLDKYDRMLGVCYAGETDINAAMVRHGLAWAFIKYSRTYEAAEAEARADRVGIWQGDAVPAWIYRQNRWQVAEAAAPDGCAIKGNVTTNGQIYHLPWSPWYHKVKIDPGRGERWFCSEAEAKSAGWRPVAVP